MIVFKKLRYKNILSTGNVFTELDLNTHETTLIVGKNGAGKSTFLDALSFVLFGKPFRKINKPQLINSINQKGMVVEVEFTVGSHDYKIVRGMKPNLFEIHQNGALVNQSAEMIDYQEYLEKNILKVNHKTFCQVVILGNANFLPFMQLTAAQRREVIEDILNLKLFTVMNALLKEKISANSDALTKNGYDKRLIEEKIKLIREHVAARAKNNVQMMEEKKQRIENSREKINNLDLNYDNICKEILPLKEQIQDETSLANRLSDVQNLISQIKVKIKTLKGDIEFYDKHDNCPTCHQSIDQNFKCNVVSEHETSITERVAGLDRLNDQRTDILERLAAIDKIKRDIGALEKKRDALKWEKQAEEGYIASLQTDLAGIVEQAEDDSATALLELDAELQALSVQYNDLMEDKQLMAVEATMLKDSGIKARIIKRYVPIINNLINKYLSSMEFMCEFELDEEFNESLKSRYCDEFSYSSFSEGEKMRINLAILFTWRAIAKLRNSVNTNLLIMDEVFDSSLDADGTDEFIKLINALTNGTNTFIISHKTDQMVDRFGKVIRFSKVKSFSRIAA